MSSVGNLSVSEQLVLARSKLWTPELDKLLRRWKTQIDTRRQAHYTLSRSYTKKHYFLGIPTTILAALIAGGVLATFRNCTDDCSGGTTPPPNPASGSCASDQWIRLVIGLVGIVSIGLTATMTFVGFGTKAEDHKTAASSYEELFGDIESLEQIPGELRGDPVGTLHSLRMQYNQIVRKSPNLPSKYHLELSYVVAHPPRAEGKQPAENRIDPQIRTRSAEESSHDLLILKEILESSDEEEEARDALERKISRENNFNSDDESKDVCIGFDIDRLAATNAVNDVVSKVRNQRERRVRNSINRSRKTTALRPLGNASVV